jgi:hypothetical protein
LLEALPENSRRGALNWVTDGQIVTKRRRALWRYEETSGFEVCTCRVVRLNRFAIVGKRQHLGVAFSIFWRFETVRTYFLVGE